MPEDTGARPLVLLPTYNERENLEGILDAIFAVQPDFHVLVIDDASPDGTGELADRRAAADERVAVLHRSGKQGLGKAYVAGFEWGLAHARGYTHLFEMDADFSHDPRYLGALLRACTEGGADMSIGSRYVPGGGTRGWPWHRQLLSRGGGLYARTLLGLEIRDPTAGFICFTRRVLETLDLHALATRGYGFQIELKYRAVRAGMRILEVPIVFVERERGQSKMDAKIAAEALVKVLGLRLRG
ncbi:polyprenol monophosphomannose synthase [Enhygromyxa salina]|uniref:Undecaprenyl-phosphate mannosyltransferase n=1 Tax=Enhygromyxa salina TaxID=215803 RepID=A0A2S9Y3C6_9BACT|nr:polyprenol monophosphomannose synthase [Enhygromyxa salina]PRP99604.1 Undecaprenyl-phosphate mannosyltransferase [Enhygromyxa salina]